MATTLYPASAQLSLAFEPLSITYWYITSWSSAQQWPWTHDPSAMVGCGAVLRCTAFSHDDDDDDGDDDDDEDDDDDDDGDDDDDDGDDDDYDDYEYVDNISRDGNTTNTNIYIITTHSSLGLNIQQQSLQRSKSRHEWISPSAEQNEHATRSSASAFSIQEGFKEFCRIFCPPL